MGDDELVEETSAPLSAGERLRQAREASGLTLEEIATTTRIPTRHLESLEAGDFARLPAPTYSIGFAKNFAAAVGLDRAEIGDQLRAEMGGSRPVMTTPEVFEPADPARAMPKWLILGGLAAILLAVLIINWLNGRSLDAPDEVAPANIAAPLLPPPVAPAPQEQNAVVITATDAAWIEVKDGAAILKQGELAAGESYAVPANAVAPTLTTAKPEALRLTVGTSQAPAIGEAGRKVTVSLKPGDVLRPAPAATAATATVQPPAPPAREPVRANPPASRRPPPPAVAAPPPVTPPRNNATQSTGTTSQPTGTTSQPSGTTPQP